MRTRNLRSPRTLRRRMRGMTLIEVLVVLGIVALISGVIAVAVIGHLERARIQTSRESARVIRGAVTSYRLDHGGDECPSVDVLVAAQHIDRASKTIDAWDKAFVIECDERGDATVVSGGPDKRVGTPDDIRVPEPPKSVAAGGRN
jgi:prepilin-type N-terminal cleavage/methylation domain-containing protein